MVTIAQARNSENLILQLPNLGDWECTTTPNSRKAIYASGKPLGHGDIQSLIHIGMKKMTKKEQETIEFYSVSQLLVFIGNNGWTGFVRRVNGGFPGDYYRLIKVRPYHVNRLLDLD